MKLSDSGLVAIAENEGFSATLYEDAGANTTIGYGHLVHLGPIDGSEPQNFRQGITTETALNMLRADAVWASDAVNSMVTADLTQAQFDALIDFAYNVGIHAFKNSSVLTSVNSGEFAAVPAALALWNKSGGRVLAGLTRRRAMEGAAFA